MGIGVPSFPDNISEIEEVKKAIGKSKGCLFQIAQVNPASNRAKPVLFEEIVRRHLITEKEMKVRIKYWTIKQCAAWLKANPPPEDEHGTIFDFLEEWKTLVQNHYLDNSGGTLAATLRLCRLYECILHPSLRAAFMKRNQQKPAYMIDARNSRKLPPDFWTQVATLANSDVVLHTRVFDVEYGEPFHVVIELRPLGKDHRYTGELACNSFFVLLILSFLVHEIKQI